MNSDLLIKFAIALCLVISACGKYPVSQSSGEVRVQLAPIDLDPREPDRVAFGHLQLIGAFQLRSNDVRFGGLSGLAFGTDGKLYAVSDSGFWFSANPQLNANGRMLDLSNWRIAPLLTPAKNPVRNLFTDAEALTRAPDGSFIVGFEQVPRLWRYSMPPETFSSAPTPVPISSEVFEAPHNGSLEAVAALPDGRVLAIAEEFENPDGSLKGWLIENGHSDPISYVAGDGFRPSDATVLGNGDVLVLERNFGFFEYFSARVKLVKAEDLRPGAKLEGKELLRLDTPLTVDNFEGIAAKETNEGTMIFLVSDDNFFFLQRTLLLQFFLPATGR